MRRLGLGIEGIRRETPIMARFTRRDFLEQSMLAAAAAAVPSVPALASEPAGRRVGANEIVRIGCVGVRGRGFAHVSTFSNFKDCQVVALCDVDPNSIHESNKRVEDKTGKKPAYYQDVRKMLEDKSIDAVSIATTNHTHSLFAIWAMQAGKHVYVEKPVSHNVVEGRHMVDAARTLNRICQGGTQNRSRGALAEAIKYIHDGKLGTVTIGQAPRPDVVPIIDRYIAPRVRRIHRGVLDGLSRAEIDTRYKPEPGEPALVTRLQDGSVVEFEDVEERADVGMTDLRQQPPFALATGETIGVVDKRRPQHFDGNVPPAPRIAGAIDLAGRPVAEQTDNLIRSESVARPQPHRVRVPS